MWPRYDKHQLVQDKCIISEITSNTFHDCDQMFFPEFLELVKYARMRFDATHYTPDRGTELDSL